MLQGWANQLSHSEKISFLSITCINSQVKSQLALHIARKWVLQLQGVGFLLYLEIWSNSININSSRSMQMVQV